MAFEPVAGYTTPQGAFPVPEVEVQSPQLRFPEIQCADFNNDAVQQRHFPVFRIRFVEFQPWCQVEIIQGAADGESVFCREAGSALTQQNLTASKTGLFRF